MKIAAILNRGGGSLRSIDAHAFADRLRERFEAAGHKVDVHLVEGDDLVHALERARDDDYEAVIAGGGDGTISAAAGVLCDTPTALGILPAGTMNLFARSLEIPLDLDEAVAALAEGQIGEVDVASANGRVFVHQFSVGMHPYLIRLRERKSFGSRLGKMRASLAAAFELINRPSRVRLELTIDGAARDVRTHSLGVTNNLFAEGHLPYTEQPAGGVLGVYVASSRKRSDFLYFLANLAIGRWRANPQVEIFTAREVVIRTAVADPRFGCAIDGELCELAQETTLEIHPRALKVIMPKT